MRTLLATNCPNAALQIYHIMCIHTREHMHT